MGQSGQAMDLLDRFIKNLSNQDIMALLNPIRCQLISEDSIFTLNAVNGSTDSMNNRFTIREFLNRLGPNWKRWIHRYRYSLAEVQVSTHTPMETTPHIKMGGFDSIDIPPTDFVVDFIEKMDKYKKRRLLYCAREGLLSDESFLNVNTYLGPDRVQVSMKKVVETMKTWELGEAALFESRPLVYKICKLSFLSSANFDKAKKADLDVRQLQSGRCKLSVFYSIFFLLMTLSTFGGHVWSNIVNYEDMEELNIHLSVTIVVIASIAIGALLYLCLQTTAFLGCCETNLHQLSVIKPCWTRFQSYFGILLYFKYRIWVIKCLHLFLLFYTIGLVIYAREFELDIYPSILCILTNGFGFIFFNRIARFLKECRRDSEDGTTLYAR
ncbi:unnamed protein product [Bursaphelenchus xylophilus]|uniref:(pine wood nematode) hypothetical protein n=1 Tax=Bursaphelenchus xylophilus TaxID=6326 RepID=A0A1I7STX1_BURXY|nr:unnamed protein product [Bursaphelenchus xylophilus]CAG9107848.1 unnamed protein product [Bursaphelenchus xylophilus]